MISRKNSMISFILYEGTLIMPPTLKKLEGHIAFGLSVRVSVCLSVCVCVNF